MIVAVRGGRAAVVGAAPPPVAGRALGKGALARSRYFTHEKALPDEAANVSRFGMEGSGFELPVPLRALFCAFADADETNLPGQGFRDRKFADSSLEEGVSCELVSEAGSVSGRMTRGPPGAISRNLGSTPCTHLTKGVCEQRQKRGV